MGLFFVASPFQTRIEGNADKDKIYQMYLQRNQLSKSETIRCQLNAEKSENDEAQIDFQLKSEPKKVKITSFFRFSKKCCKCFAMDQNWFLSLPRVSKDT